VFPYRSGEVSLSYGEEESSLVVVGGAIRYDHDCGVGDIMEMRR
jgi:hypothetical protein